MRSTRVEILYFEGCPNSEGARELVERIAAELQVDPEVELVEVRSPEAAVELRFLGSPTVRIDGRDVERGAEDREEFALSCRLYRTVHGVSGQPADASVRAALAKAQEQAVRRDT